MGGIHHAIYGRTYHPSTISTHPTAAGQELSSTIMPEAYPPFVAHPSPFFSDESRMEPNIMPPEGGRRDLGRRLPLFRTIPLHIQQEQPNTNSTRTHRTPVRHKAKQGRQSTKHSLETDCSTTTSVQNGPLICMSMEELRPAQTEISSTRHPPNLLSSFDKQLCWLPAGFSLDIRHG